MPGAVKIKKKKGTKIKLKKKKKKGRGWTLTNVEGEGGVVYITSVWYYTAVLDTINLYNHRNSGHH